MDWIADELFIVAYVEDQRELEYLANLGVHFCSRLIHEKTLFRANHPAPDEIDVGMSLGPTFVGLMGPAGQAKATALGEVPGQARRLQSLGKYLREHFGAKDRIIFGPGLMGHLNPPLVIEEFEIESDSLVKDLGSRQFYYIAPGKKFDAFRSKDVA